MKKSALVIALAALGCLSEQAMAQQTPWLVRARAVHISPANKSDPVDGVGAADTIHVSEKTIPEVDISYFFTPNWAAELILTYPQKHDVTLNGANIDAPGRDQLEATGTVLAASVALVNSPGHA